tara:strand:+ start:115 stop:381 length:267 start_codon:yes stop_codon:yes gene_type:complete
MKKILANLFIVLTISAVPAYFLSGLNASRMFVGCEMGVAYYSGKEPPDDVCHHVIREVENVPQIWIFSALALTLGIAKTIGFWDPDKD